MEKEQDQAKSEPVQQVDAEFMDTGVLYERPKPKDVKGQREEGEGR